MTQPDGMPWCTLDRLFASPAGKWIDAQEKAWMADIEFEALLIGDDDVPDPILPGRDFVRVTYDLSDWSGISLEFTGYEGEPPTEAEQQRIWDMGFTVIRIDYRDEARHTRQHGLHGDWSAVKPREDK